MGPNNTNTTTPNQPTAANKTGASAFSGSNPTKNPFTRNSFTSGAIPPSNNGDIILTPSTPAKTRSKKPLIIGAVAILIIIALAVFATMSLQRKSGNDSDGAVSTSSLRGSFDKLAQTIITGEASGAPDYSVPSSNWKIIQVANDASVSEQATYAETLKSAHDSFATKLNDYIAQYPDQDLATLSSDGATLSDQITASVLYLRAGQFADEILKSYATGEDANTLIEQEISSAEGSFDSAVANLVNDISFYHRNQLSRYQALSAYGCINQESVVQTCLDSLNDTQLQELQAIDDELVYYASSANNRADAVLGELPTYILSVNTILRQIDE